MPRHWLALLYMFTRRIATLHCAARHYDMRRHGQPEFVTSGMKYVVVMSALVNDEIWRLLWLVNARILLRRSLTLIVNIKCRSINTIIRFKVGRACNRVIRIPRSMSLEFHIVDTKNTLLFAGYVDIARHGHTRHRQ